MYFDLDKYKQCQIDLEDKVMELLSCLLLIVGGVFCILSLYRFPCNVLIYNSSRKKTFKSLFL